MSLVKIGSVLVELPARPVKVTPFAGRVERASAAFDPTNYIIRLPASDGEAQLIAHAYGARFLDFGNEPNLIRPHEVLRAATLGSSEIIGRATELGSIEAGKFADLLILDRDPLADITNTTSLSFVMKNGRLYGANTLEEVWPCQKSLESQWFWRDAPTSTSASD